MLSRFGTQAVRRNLVTQAKRNFGADAHQLPEPTFLAQKGSSNVFVPLVLVGLGLTTYYTTVNMSAQIYYPDETEALVQDYKAGLRNADFSPKGRSLDQY
eukprot:UN01026